MEREGGERNVEREEGRERDGGTVGQIDRDRGR